MASASVAFPPPPPGFNYLAAIQPSLWVLLVSVVWSSFLVPLLFILFFFSSTNLRRKPIFLLNVLSILLGIGLGLLHGAIQVNVLVNPIASPSIALYLSLGCMMILIPLAVDSILLLRIVAVYPPKKLIKRTTYGIYIPLVLLKLGRTINAGIFLYQYALLFRTSANPVQAGGQAWIEFWGSKVELCLQFTDNSVSSFLFIRRLEWGRGASNVRAKSSPFSAKLRRLFWTSISNFVFPSLLSVSLLIAYLRDPDIIPGTCILLSNVYVEIIGVLLATVWSAGSHWVDQNDADLDVSLSTVPSVPVFRSSRS